MVHYNNGGVIDIDKPVNDFLSGGIRPLNLSDDEIDALVTFMEALTSESLVKATAGTPVEVTSKQVSDLNQSTRVVAGVEQ